MIRLGDADGRSTHGDLRGGLGGAHALPGGLGHQEVAGAHVKVGARDEHGARLEVALRHVDLERSGHGVETAIAGRGPAGARGHDVASLDSCGALRCERRREASGST